MPLIGLPCPSLTTVFGQAVAEAVVSITQCSKLSIFMWSYCYFQGLAGGEVEYNENGSILSHSTVEWMNSGFGLINKSNAWAGPDHWKYRNPRGSLIF